MSFDAKPLREVGVEVLAFDIGEPITNAMKDELKSLCYERGIEGGHEVEHG